MINVLFLFNSVIGRGLSADLLGPIRWQMVLANLVAFILVFLVLFMSIKSLGKVHVHKLSVANEI